MEIRLANSKDLQGVIQYDKHIPEDRVAACIREGQVYVLRDGEEILGILRFSLFWQSVPFLDLMYLDEICRGKGHGSRMMTVWEEAMKEKQYEYVMLSTQEDETAKFFYEKLDYRRIGAFLPPEQEADELIYLKML